MEHIDIIVCSFMENLFARKRIKAEANSTLNILAGKNDKFFGSLLMLSILTSKYNVYTCIHVDYNYTDSI